MFSLLPISLRALLAWNFWWADVDSWNTNATPSLRFQLRHQHAVSNTTRIVFSDMASSLVSDEYGVATQRVTSHRPLSFSAFSSARFRAMRHKQNDALLWQKTDVLGPNVTDRESLLTLAKMTGNAYTKPNAKDWYDLGSNWNASHSFGWEPDADGFRGHVFVSDDNSTVIISIKGTSAGWLAGSPGPTIKKDQLNDNLLFSCCCARVDASWTPVCGCYAGTNKCDQTCLETSLLDDGLYYPTGVNLYNNVTYMYPNANIWMIGHSLGGGLASLVGVTFGAPTVAFEAPAEKLAATRLHLPSPPSTHHITHVYHTADPIPMGTCTGITSTCGLGGYALESRCHLGQVLRYDTVGKLGWSVSARTHPISVVIEKLLIEDWEPGVEGGEGRQVPPIVHEDDCVDCFQWEYGDFKK